MHDSTEKSGLETLSVSQEENAVQGPYFTLAEEKKIIRRVNMRVVLMCGLMFCFSLMDRTNLGAAAIAGMTKDLTLVKYRYVSFLRVQL